MSEKVATWEVSRISHYETMREIARKLRKCYNWCMAAILLVLVGCAFRLCDCNIVAIVLQSIGVAIIFVGCIWSMAIVGNARCCNCGGGVLIWRGNFRKFLDGYFPLCKNCRKTLGIDFIKPPSQT